MSRACASGLKNKRMALRRHSVSPLSTELYACSSYRFVWQRFVRLSSTASAGPSQIIVASRSTDRKRANPTSTLRHPGVVDNQTGQITTRFVFDGVATNYVYRSEAMTG